MLSVVARACEQFYHPPAMLVTLKSFIVPVILAMLLSGCGATHYKITLRDGREFMAASQPELNRKTGYYKFRNLSDKDALIRAEDVLMIDEL